MWGEVMAKGDGAPGVEQLHFAGWRGGGSMSRSRSRRRGERSGGRSGAVGVGVERVSLIEFNLPSHPLPPSSPSLLLLLLLLRG